MNIASWLLLLCTVVAWGATPVLEKTALRGVEPLDGLFVRNIGACLIFLIFFAFAGRMKNITAIPSKNLGLFILSGILAGFIGMFCYYAILKINPSSKIVPLAATYPLVAAFLGIIFLKEDVTAVRIVGTILIVIGVLLVK